MNWKLIQAGEFIVCLPNWHSVVLESSARNSTNGYTTTNLQIQQIVKNVIVSPDTTNKFVSFTISTMFIT